MDIASATEPGKMMELVDEKGVGLVVRVVLNPSKEIGLKILAAFQYKRPVRTMVCKKMEEAEEALGV